MDMQAEGNMNLPEHWLILYRGAEGIMQVAGEGVPTDFPTLPNAKATRHFLIETESIRLHCFFESDMEESNAKFMAEIYLAEKGI